MSGPIVRKYGFPNFEKIFGAQDAQHGAEEAKAPDAGAKATPAPPGSGEAKEPVKPKNDKNA